MNETNKVTIKITLEIERTLELTQKDKPSHYSNVEWEEQQIINACQDAEMQVDGNCRSDWQFIRGGYSAEIPT